MPYCIPDKRELTGEERQLLQRLSDDSAEIQRWFSQLSVVARCGCGTCPTILFGQSMEDEPVTSAHAERLAEWEGRTTTGILVQIVLYAANGQPTELEACSPEGDDIDCWPPVDAIQQILESPPTAWVKRKAGYPLTSPLARNIKRR